MSAPDDNPAEVLRLLTDRAGIDVDALGPHAVARAVDKRRAAAGQSPGAYALRLSRDPAEFQALVEQLTVPETWFFREPAAFRFLERRLAERNTPRRGVFRVLSVGCSTGEEAYALAIVGREAGFSPGEHQVVGVDVNRLSLDRAREGRFGPRAFREEDPWTRSLCDRWFEPEGPARRVRDDLRASVEFRWGNLAEDDFLLGEAPFDAIFCRNVLIYFHERAREKTAVHLRRLLGPKGFVCVASAEARILSEAGFIAAEAPNLFVRAPLVPRNDAALLPELPAGRRDFAPRAARAVLPAVAPRVSRQEIAEDRPADEPDDRAAALAAALRAADDGRLADAESLCRRVLATDPLDAEAHYVLGVVQQSQGRCGDARQSLERAVYLAPRHYQALVHLMLLAEQRGETDAAANFRRRARQIAAGEA